MDQNWCKGSNICLGNDQDNSQLHRFTKSENITKNLRGLLFWLALYSVECRHTRPLNVVRQLVEAICVCLFVCLDATNHDRYVGLLILRVHFTQ